MTNKKAIATPSTRVFGSYDLTNCEYKNGIFSGVCVYTNQKGKTQNALIVAELSKSEYSGTEELKVKFFMTANDQEKCLHNAFGERVKSLIINTVDRFAREDKEQKNALAAEVKESEVARKYAIATAKKHLDEIRKDFPTISKAPKVIQNMYRNYVAELAEYDPALAEKYANKK